MSSENGVSGKAAPEGALPARDRVVEAFRRATGREPDCLVRAPGRVNLLGGHVDYSEGWVLPAAIEPALWLAASRLEEPVWRLEALDLGESVELPLERLAPPVPERPESPSSAGWQDYPAGVAWALRDAGHEPIGIEAVYASDLPIGAGVSSSAALEVAFLLAQSLLGGPDPGRRAQAFLGRICENRYLGVGSGIMDQYASLFGRAHRALLLDCRTVEHREIPVPESLQVLVVDTRVRRRLVGSGFNDRRAECERAVELLRERLPDIRTLRDVSPEELGRHADVLPTPLDRRARHAVHECRRVLDGAAALERGDLEALARAMRESHRSSRDLYEVTIPELDLLAETAWELAGCHGARLAGGGFGGCVLCLVEQDRIEPVERELANRFEERFGRPPAFLRSAIGDGAGLA